MFLKGFEDYMIPCLNKKIFGIECLGCGTQRATALLFQGEFVAAFEMYPAIYTIFLLLGIVVLNLFIKFKYASKIKIALLIINVIIIIISYFYKMNTVH